MLNVKKCFFGVFVLCDFDFDVVCVVGVEVEGIDCVVDDVEMLIVM